MSTDSAVWLFPKISVGAGFNRPFVISSSSRLKSQVFHHVGNTQLNFGEELLFGCFEYHTVY